MGSSIICTSWKKKNTRNEIRVNENLTGHKAVPVEISNKVKNSICKIIIKREENILGTGFFMKIESLKFLFTNYHVIKQEFINDNIELEIWNKKKMNLNLNQRYIKYFEDPKDVIIIEIKKEDNIYKDIKFLDYDTNYNKEGGYNNYEKVDVFTLQHPLGNDVSCASGKISEIINDYEFSHNISTEKGSSGCPIIKLDNNINLILVIGIHKASDSKKEINYGTFIGGIIDELKNDSIFFQKSTKNKEQKKERKDKEEEEKEEEKEVEEEKEEQEEIEQEEIEQEEIEQEKIEQEEIEQEEVEQEDNFIIAQINIKKKEINKFIRIINSYEEYMGYQGHNDYYLEESVKNEKEIKQCEIKINEKKVQFTYFYAFENEGIYTIKYTFKNLLTKTHFLFFNCPSLISIDLSNFNIQNSTDMRCMFDRCSSLKEINLSNFNAPNAIYMNSMFYECSSLKEINLSNFNAPNAENMSYMFYGCSSLKEINLSNFKAPKVIDMSYMFYECSSLKEINLSNFNAPNAENMSYMFYGCSSLKNIDLSNFNTQNVFDMSDMFSKCSSLKNIDLSNFNTQNAFDMNNMFSECSSLKNIDLSSFNTQNVINMSNMFSKCSSLKNIDLSSFNTQNVIDMSNMFSECSSLKNIDLSSFNTRNVTDMCKMFYKCSSLKAANLHNFIFSKVNCDHYYDYNYDKIFSCMFFKCSNLYGKDINIKDHSIREILKPLRF